MLLNRPISRRWFTARNRRVEAGIVGLKNRTGRVPELANRFATVAVLLVVAACSTATPTGPDTPPPPPPPPTGPSALVVAAGNAQVGPAGSPAPADPQVRVTTHAGTGVAGVSVQFQVTGGGGAVEHSSAVSDAQGIASAGTWTLGAAGSQQLVATLEGVGAVQFNATATATPAAIAGTDGDGQSAAVGTAVPVGPQVRVTDADGGPVADVNVTFAVAGGGGSVSGGEVTTDSDGFARVGGWTLGMTAGPNSLSAVIEGASIAGNPVMFSATGLAGQAAAVAATQGEGQTASGGNPVPVRPQVRVTDANGNGVPGVSVSFVISGGGGSLSGANQSTGSDGRATVGNWFLGSGAGANVLTATAAVTGIPGNPVTFNATSTGISSGGSGTYDIELRYNPGSSPTGPQSTAFAQAEAKWESVISGDLIDTPVNRSAGTCTSTTAINETVDDLIIYVTLEAIDGAGGVLGSAGPCLVRSGSLLTLVGQMRLDIADLAAMEASGTMDEVIAHEMGHVLGIGALWSALGLLTDPSLSGGLDPHFTGAGAIAGFNSVGGSGYAGPKVPVEDTGGSGTADGHWRETVFGKELMTGWINSGSNPLSIVTVRSLADMGYSVNAGAADGYGLPASTLIVPAPGASHTRLVMYDDIWRVPLEMIAPNGVSAGMIPR